MVPGRTRGTAKRFPSDRKCHRNRKYDPSLSLAFDIAKLFSLSIENVFLPDEPEAGRNGRDPEDKRRVHAKSAKQWSLFACTMCRVKTIYSSEEVVVGSIWHERLFAYIACHGATVGWSCSTFGV